MIVNMADNPFDLVFVKCKYFICENKTSVRSNLKEKCAGYQIFEHKLVISNEQCDYTSPFLEINM